MKFTILAFLLLSIHIEVLSINKSPLDSPAIELRNRLLIEKTLTVLQNKKTIIPIQKLEHLEIASLSIGSDTVTAFQRMLENYTEVTHFVLPRNGVLSAVLKKKLKKFDIVIVGIHKADGFPTENYGVSNEMISMLKTVVTSSKTIVALFGNPFALASLKKINKAAGLIVAYQESQAAEELTGQLIFGAIGANGKLTETINKNYKAGDGLQTQSLQRFKYTLPEELNLNSLYINAKIDSICQRAIGEKAFPGCVVFVAKRGKVIVNKAYGFHTYENTTPMRTTDLFDLASVTKVSAATPCYMKLYDQGKINLDAKYSQYYKDFRGTEKENLVFREVLAHQARFTAWLPFWKAPLEKDGRFKPNTLSRDSSAAFPIKVAEHLFAHKKYNYQIYKTIKESPLLVKKEYVYSDLSFILAPKVVERMTYMDFEKYVKNTFYRPLGAYTLTYNPRKYYTLDRIVPTEGDTLFRKQLVHGYVHDETAALLGGVSGHAGLFGTANDLAKLWQMYLQMGVYGGKRFFAEATVKEFTRCQFCDQGNRRGLGFDKPLLINKQKGTPSPDASADSFGHSGFTGTFVWVDPQNELLYILLTNRVYPTRNNSKISELNIRTSIHQLFY